MTALETIFLNFIGIPYFTASSLSSKVINHLRERPGLGSIAEHGNRLSGERLTDEVRDHHSVLSRLAWSDGIEEPHDDDRQLALFPIRQRQELVDGLAARVRPAVLRCRAHH